MTDILEILQEENATLHASLEKLRACHGKAIEDSKKITATVEKQSKVLIISDEKTATIPENFDEESKRKSKALKIT